MSEEIKQKQEQQYISILKDIEENKKKLENASNEDDKKNIQAELSRLETIKNELLKVNESLSSLTIPNLNENEPQDFSTFEDDSNPNEEDVYFSPQDIYDVMSTPNEPIKTPIDIVDDDVSEFLDYHPYIKVEKIEGEDTYCFSFYNNKNDLENELRVYANANGVSIGNETKKILKENEINILNFIVSNVINNPTFSFNYSHVPSEDEAKNLREYVNNLNVRKFNWNNPTIQTLGSNISYIPGENVLDLGTPSFDNIFLGRNSHRISIEEGDKKEKFDVISIGFHPSDNSKVFFVDVKRNVQTNEVFVEIAPNKDKDGNVIPLSLPSEEENYALEVAKNFIEEYNKKLLSESQPDLFKQCNDEYYHNDWKGKKEEKPKPGFGKNSEFLKKINKVLKEEILENKESSANLLTRQNYIDEFLSKNQDLLNLNPNSFVIRATEGSVDKNYSLFAFSPKDNPDIFYIAKIDENGTISISPYGFNSKDSQGKNRIPYYLDIKDINCEFVKQEGEIDYFDETSAKNLEELKDLSQDELEARKISNELLKEVSSYFEEKTSKIKDENGQLSIINLNSKITNDKSVFADKYSLLARQMGDDFVDSSKFLTANQQIAATLNENGHANDKVFEDNEEEFARSEGIKFDKNDEKYERLGFKNTVAKLGRALNVDTRNPLGLISSLSNQRTDILFDIISPNNSGYEIKDIPGVKLMVKLGFFAAKLGLMLSAGVVSHVNKKLTIHNDEKRLKEYTQKLSINPKRQSGLKLEELSALNRRFIDKTFQDLGKVEYARALKIFKKRGVYTSKDGKDSVSGFDSPKNLRKIYDIAEHDLQSSFFVFQLNKMSKEKNETVIETMLNNEQAMFESTLARISNGFFEKKIPKDVMDKCINEYQLYLMRIKQDITVIYYQQNNMPFVKEKNLVDANYIFKQASKYRKNLEKNLVDYIHKNYNQDEFDFENFNDPSKLTQVELKESPFDEYQKASLKNAEIFATETIEDFESQFEEPIQKNTKIGELYKEDKTIIKELKSNSETPSNKMEEARKKSSINIVNQAQNGTKALEDKSTINKDNDANIIYEQESYRHKNPNMEYMFSCSISKGKADIGNKNSSYLLLMPLNKSNDELSYSFCVSNDLSTNVELDDRFEKNEFTSIEDAYDYMKSRIKELNTSEEGIPEDMLSCFKNLKELINNPIQLEEAKKMARFTDEGKPKYTINKKGERSFVVPQNRKNDIIL